MIACRDFADSVRLLLSAVEGNQRWHAHDPVTRCCDRIFVHINGHHMQEAASSTAIWSSTGAIIRSPTVPRTTAARSSVAPESRL